MSRLLGALHGAVPRPVDVVAALPPELDVVVVRDGRHAVVAVAPDEVLRASGPDGLDALGDLAPGWWAGWLSYDLGRSVERIRPRAGAGGDAHHDPHDLWSDDVVLGRFDARLVLDPVAGWARVVGDGPSRPLLEQALADAVAGRSRPVVPRPLTGPWTSSLGRDDWESAVGDVLELIARGDCYQVNLTRRLSVAGEADPRALHARLDAHNPAPHAALVVLGPTAVVSASPEQFLRRSGRRVVTRPIKGTGADAAALLASEKDRAENVMIVDLARNDLGRVCRPGSIRTTALCALEPHPGLFHLVSSVEGVLAPDVDVAQLVRATFPPASVTGAPKPRVLQAIEDLEPVRRGVYCGAVGWIDTAHDRLDLNVAIRTFAVGGGATHLGVGCGIVADSEPAAEWRESELKAARLLAAAAASDPVAQRSAGPGHGVDAAGERA